MVPRSSLALLAALALAPAVGRASAADALRQAAHAMSRHDLGAAYAAYQRAFEARHATAEERREALGGLVEAAVGAGRAAQLLAYVRRRQADAPADQHPLFRSAAVRCQMALDGHLHGAIAALNRLAKDNREDRDARYRADALREVCRRLGGLGAQLAREMHRMASGLPRAAQRKPPPQAVPRRAAVTVPRPQRPEYALRPLRLTRPPRRPPSGQRPLVRLRPPYVPRARASARASVVRPKSRRPHLNTLAATFLRHAYQKSRELAAGGLVETAKAELAMVIELFPETDEAQRAAQYAIRIFQRRGDDDRQAEALAAYLAWVRAMTHFKGVEQAEYQALRSFWRSAEAAAIAREAAAFIRRHPDSAYAPAVRTRLALALEATGQPDKAIEALRPVAQAPDSKSRARALHVLAWLHLFEGQGARARDVLQQLAAQTSAPDAALQAQKLLQELAARPPDKRLLPPAVPPGQAEEALAHDLLDAAGRLLRAGDPERAMDLYTLYLRVGDDTPDFRFHRDRIRRFRDTGEMEEE